MTLGGSYCAETNAVVKDVKQQNIESAEIVDSGLAYDIVPANGTVSYSTAVSSNEPNTFMQSYFNCLTTNMGQNYKGSCGYVAIGMLLSYYDTFLNDNIIPEQYDRASVGTGMIWLQDIILPEFTMILLHKQTALLIIRIALMN